jgi:predicted anti-sigma-YlaC factor YlaD
MNISPDVISDLLPLYLAGEASAATRALVEEYLREHPAFAEQVREQVARSTRLLTAATPSASVLSDHEKATLERVRRFNRRRSYVLACSLALTMIPFSFAFVGDRVNWMMLRDNPREALFLWIAAAVCWMSYYVMGRRLRMPAA